MKNYTLLSIIIFGFIGLHYIRIEFSGNKILDTLNKNINSNWFNAILTLLILFILIQNITAPFLNNLEMLIYQLYGHLWNRLKEEKTDYKI